MKTALKICHGRILERLYLPNFRRRRYSYKLQIAEPMKSESGPVSLPLLITSANINIRTDVDVGFGRKWPAVNAKEPLLTGEYDAPVSVVEERMAESRIRLAKQCLTVPEIVIIRHIKGLGVAPPAGGKDHADSVFPLP